MTFFRDIKATGRVLAEVEANGIPGQRVEASRPKGAPMSGRQGVCSVCHFSFRLRVDGTVQAHSLYYGSERLPRCAGSGAYPLPAPVGASSHRIPSRGQA